MGKEGEKEVTFPCKENCGECCGIVGFDPRIFARNKDRRQRKVTELYKSEGQVYPLTEDHLCCFLTLEKNCAVYLWRPDVCKRYGTDDKLKCPYFDTTGKARTEEEVQVIKVEIEKYIDERIKNITGGTQK